MGMVRLAGGALLNALVVNPESGLSLSAQVAVGLRQAIFDGSLRPGERLPATRELARELRLARSTVVEAFEQLVSEGLILSRVGSGSFVADLALEIRGPVETPRGSHRSAQVDRLMRLASHQIVQRVDHLPRPFTTAMPALDVFPLAQWHRLVNRSMSAERASVMGYADPTGLPALRAAIVRHLRGNRGIDCDPRQVFVTSGAQQAFQILALTLVDKDDTVWFEDPGAIGARNCFVLQGARVEPIPVDDDGMMVAEGLARAPGFKLAFVTPAHQHPLGSRMSHERRLALLAAAARADALVIEDDWDGDLYLTGRPQPALKTLDTQDRVIHVGSFSKTMFPALRLGFMVVPFSLQADIASVLRAYGTGVPTSIQSAMASFIDEGSYATHIRRMRRLYTERQEALLEATDLLSPWLTLTRSQTGLQTLGWLAPGLEAETVARAADKAGLSVLPFSRFCLRPYPREALLLGFAGTPIPQIRTGTARLAEILARVATATKGQMVCRFPESGRGQQANPR